MRDLVEIFQKYCDDNDMIFSYGTQSTQNLLQETQDGDVVRKVHLLSDLIKDSDILNQYGTKVIGKDFSGLLMLGVPADYTGHIYNENESDIEASKYNLNVKPLKALKLKLANDLLCDDLEVKFTGAIDVYNYKDINLDGIIFSFNIKHIF